MFFFVRLRGPWLGGACDERFHERFHETQPCAHRHHRGWSHLTSIFAIRATSQPHQYWTAIAEGGAWYHSGHVFCCGSCFLPQVAKRLVNARIILKMMRDTSSTSVSHICSQHQLHTAVTVTGGSAHVGLCHINHE